MRILLTGATGLVGTEITRLLHEKGIHVNYLTTRKNKIEKGEEYRGFFWDPSSGEIDEACLQGVGAIINLAGESVFEPWTKKNKQKILNSRLDSLNLLYRLLKENSHQVGQIISASAIGIYPSSLQKMHYEEETAVDNSFLGEVVQKWEKAVDPFEELGLRVAKVRLGIVLSNKGGALPQMQRPLRYNVGTSLGSGKQWQSWIHITDVARLFLHVLENGLSGVYNAVAPNPVTNEDLIGQMAETMDKKVWLPKVPSALLKVTMGEMSTVILSSQLVSSDKILGTGFKFYYINLKQAFESLWQQKTG